MPSFDGTNGESALVGSARMQLTESSGAMPGLRQVALKVLVSVGPLAQVRARQRVALLAALRRAFDVGAEELQAVQRQRLRGRVALAAGAAGAESGRWRTSCRSRRRRRASAKNERHRDDDAWADLLGRRTLAVALSNRRAVGQPCVPSPGFPTCRSREAPETPGLGRRPVSARRTPHRAARRVQPP